MITSTPNVRLLRGAGAMLAASLLLGGCSHGLFRRAKPASKPPSKSAGDEQSAANWLRQPRVHQVP